MIKFSKQTIKLSLIFVIIATVIITQTACKNTKDVEPVSKEGFYLDTVCKISIYDMDGDPVSYTHLVALFARKKREQ